MISALDNYGLNEEDVFETLKIAFVKYCIECEFLDSDFLEAVQEILDIYLYEKLLFQDGEQGPGA